jgi:hypothetical protein
MLIDCSAGWYLEEMKSKPQVTLLSILKSRIRVLVPKFILSFIRRIKKKSVEGYVVESFGDIDLPALIFMIFGSILNLLRIILSDTLPPIR